MNLLLPSLPMGRSSPCDGIRPPRLVRNLSLAGVGIFLSEISRTTPYNRVVTRGYEPARPVADEFEDALRSCCEAVGVKQMAHELWPERSPADGAKTLSRCLDLDRPEKLSAGQIALILRRARENGCHVGMAYLTRQCGYADPTPVDPEDEKARLAREFVQAVDLQSKLIKRLEALK